MPSQVPQEWDCFRRNLNRLTTPRKLLWVLELWVQGEPKNLTCVHPADPENLHKAGCCVACSCTLFHFRMCLCWMTLKLGLWGCGAMAAFSVAALGSVSSCENPAAPPFLVSHLSLLRKDSFRLLHHIEILSGQVLVCSG